MPASVERDAGVGGIFKGVGVYMGLLWVPCGEATTTGAALGSVGR